METKPKSPLKTIAIKVEYEQEADVFNKCLDEIEFFIDKRLPQYFAALQEFTTLNQRLAASSNKEEKKRIQNRLAEVKRFLDSSVPTPEVVVNILQKIRLAFILLRRLAKQLSETLPLGKSLDLLFNGLVDRFLATARQANALHPPPFRLLNSISQPLFTKQDVAFLNDALTRKDEATRQFWNQLNAFWKTGVEDWTGEIVFYKPRFPNVSQPVTLRFLDPAVIRPWIEAVKTRERQLADAQVRMESRNQLRFGLQLVKENRRVGRIIDVTPINQKNHLPAELDEILEILNEKGDTVSVRNVNGAVGNVPKSAIREEASTPSPMAVTVVAKPNRTNSGASKLDPEKQDAFKSQLLQEKKRVCFVTNSGGLDINLGLMQGEVLEFLVEIGLQSQIRTATGQIHLIPTSAITILPSVSETKSNDSQSSATRKTSPDDQDSFPVLTRRFKDRLERDGKPFAVAIASTFDSESGEAVVKHGEVLEILEEMNDKEFRVANYCDKELTVEKNTLLIPQNLPPKLSKPAAAESRLLVENQAKLMKLLEKTSAKALKVRMPFTATNPEELTVFAGEIVECLDDSDPERIRVKAADGNSGYVPKSNLVEFNTSVTVKQQVSNSLSNAQQRSSHADVLSKKGTKRETEFIDLEKIGSGAFGKATLATRITDGKQVVIKEIQLDGENNDKILAEGILLAKYQHKCIVKFMGYFIENDKLYIATQYCAKGNLRKAINAKKKEDGRFEEPIISKWTWQVSLALEYLHGLGIIHRDVKAENVFITETDDVKLGDLGAAAQLSKTLQEMQRSTFAGTMPYIAPEMFGGLSYDCKVDVWSLGVLVYFLASFALPFGDDSFTYSRVMSKDPPPPLPSSCSSILVSFVQRLLVHDPAQRPYMKDVLAELFLTLKNTSVDSSQDQQPPTLPTSQPKPRLGLPRSTYRDIIETPSNSNSVQSRDDESNPTPPMKTVSKRENAYKDIEKLTIGAFGHLILATRVDTPGKNVVIKEVELDHQTALGELTSFAKHTHACIARLNGLFEENGKIYIETQYYPGGTLQKAITQKLSEADAKFDEDEIRKWAWQLALALEHLHDHGIVHRDVTADNIFLTNHNDVKLGCPAPSTLVDKFVASCRTPQQHTVIDGSAMAYIAPEMYAAAVDGSQYDSKVDVWSLGVLVYYLATLQLPFGSDTNVVARVMSKRSPPALPNWCCSDLVRFVGKLLKHNPVERPNIKQALAEPFILTEDREAAL